MCRLSTSFWSSRVTTRDRIGRSCVLFAAALADHPSGRIAASNTPPGAQAQTDWGEYSGIDLGDGPECLSVFVMALSWSRETAIVWSRRKEMLSWLHCHNESFVRLQGILPSIGLTMSRPRWFMARGAGDDSSELSIVCSFGRFPHRSLSAKAATSERQGRSEGPPQSLASWGPRASFDGLEDLQATTDQRLDDWARRAKCPATGTCVQEAWEQEISFLRPLPECLPEPFDVSVTRPVGKDCMVHFEGRLYPVPFQYVGRHVEVRGAKDQVQILSQDEILRIHPRHGNGRIVIDPSCYEGNATEEAVHRPLWARWDESCKSSMRCRSNHGRFDLYAALAEVAR